MNCKKNRQRVYDIGTALALIGYPLLAGFAFAVHPDLFSLAISHDVSLKIVEFHGNDLLHFGHFLMLLGAPLLIAIAAHFQKQITRPRGWWWLGYIGMLLASAGAIILVVDKTALCLVPSAFDTLTEAQFARLMDGLSTHFNLTDDPEREYSIEIDPRSTDLSTLPYLASIGLNRLSLGVQDFDPEVQKTVNRLQSRADTLALVTQARAHGFG